jgi:hypothetical protein
MIYTHVLDFADGAVTSPLDELITTGRLMSPLDSIAP